MHSCTFHRRSTRLLDSLNYLSWTYQCGLSHGWSMRRVLLPSIPDVTSMVGIPPWGFYIYKVRSPTPWIFKFYRFSAMSIPDRFRDSVHLVCILSWWFPFDCFVSNFFRGSSGVVGETWLRFLCNLVCTFRPNLLIILRFFSGCLFLWSPLLPFILWVCSLSLVPLWKGLQFF